MTTTYPYWLVITRKGKLQAPLEYRGTSVEREFTSGRIGGLSVKEDRYITPRDALHAYFAAKRCNEHPDVYVVEARNEPRRRLQYPEQSLSTKFTIVGLETLQHPSCKLLLNDTAVAFFTTQSQHNSLKIAGLSYEDDYKGNALAGICSERKLEIRYHKDFSDARVQQILVSLSRDIPKLKSYTVTYQGRPISFA